MPDDDIVEKMARKYGGGAAVADDPVERLAAKYGAPAPATPDPVEALAAKYGAPEAAPAPKPERTDIPPVMSGAFRLPGDRPPAGRFDEQIAAAKAKSAAEDAAFPVSKESRQRLLRAKFEREAPAIAGDRRMTQGDGPSDARTFARDFPNIKTQADADFAEAQMAQSRLASRTAQEVSEAAVPGNIRKLPGWQRALLQGGTAVTEFARGATGQYGGGVFGGETADKLNAALSEVDPWTRYLRMGSNFAGAGVGIGAAGKALGPTGGLAAYGAVSTPGGLKERTLGAAELVAFGKLAEGFTPNTKALLEGLPDGARKAVIARALDVASAGGSFTLAGTAVKIAKGEDVTKETAALDFVMGAAARGFHLAVSKAPPTPGEDPAVTATRQMPPPVEAKAPEAPAEAPTRPVEAPKPEVATEATPRGAEPVAAPVEPVRAATEAPKVEAPAPEAPAAPREEVIQPRDRSGERVKSADTLEAEATKNAGLAQLVRREGGIDLTRTNLTGEVNAMRLKESGTTGLVRPNGGGNSKSIQRLMEAAKEEGFDVEGMSETQFVERVLADAQGDRTLNWAEVDSDKLGAAALRRQAEQENARWQEERARGLAESKPAPEPSTTSNKNAVVNAEREGRGVGKLPEAERQSNKSVNDRALKKMDANPDAGRALVEELNKTNRPHTAEEEAILRIHRRDLHKSYDSAAADVIRGYEKNDPEAVAVAKAAADRISADFLELESASKSSGRETARALQSRQREIAEDYSLVKMVTRRRVAKDGKPLTEAEMAETKRLHDELAKAVADRDAYHAKLVEIEALAGADRAIRKGASRTAPPRQSAEYGKSNKVVTRESYEKAKAELRAKLTRLNALAPVDIIPELAKMATFHIEAAGRSFGRWVTSLKEDLKPEEYAKVEPHLKAAWEQSSKELSGKSVEEVVGKLRAGVEAGKGIEKMPTNVHDLAEAIVAGGVKDRVELIDKVHEVLKTVDPEITRRETMDAISGYGKVSIPSDDPVKVQLREYKGQLQQDAKLEDMAAGKAPLASGPRRQPAGDVQRELIRLVNEAKRKGGYTVRDPEAQLRSALDGAKTRMRHAIADMAREIAAGKKDIQDRTELKLDAEAQALKAELDAMRKTWQDVFGKPGMTEAQRVDAAIKATEKSIAEYERKIEAGDVFPGKKASKTPDDPRLTALRATRDALAEQAADIRAAFTPRRSPSEVAAQARKTRRANQIAFLENALATGDYAPKPRKSPPPMDAQDVAHEARIDVLKRKVAEQLFRDKLANENLKQRAVRTAWEVSHTSRALATSFDFSALFRQLLVTSVAHPIRTARALPVMFKSFGSPIAGGHAMAAAEAAGANPLRALMAGFKAAGEAGRMAQARSDAEIRMRPNYALMKKAGVHFSEHGMVDAKKMEEAYQSRWAEAMPFVAGSSRAFSALVNRVRADAFDVFAASWKNGRTLTMPEAKEIAAVTNIITGRGGAQDNRLLNGATPIIWSPRLLASRLQLLSGPLRGFGFSEGASARTRGLVAAEYARFLGGMALMYTLGAIAADEIVLDPRASDFGKLIFKGKDEDSRLDLGGGMLQVIRLMASLGHRTAASMGIVNKDRQDRDTTDTAWNFARTKFAPFLGAYFSGSSERKPTGEKTTWGQEALGLVTPMSMEDVRKAMVQQGAPKGVALGFLNLLGMSLQTYKKKHGGK